MDPASPELPSGIGTGNSTSAPMSTPVTPSTVFTASCAAMRSLTGVIVASKAPSNPDSSIFTYPEPCRTFGMSMLAPSAVSWGTSASSRRIRTRAESTVTMPRSMPRPTSISR